MKVQIEKQIEVSTDRNFEGLNAIIEAALTSTNPKTAMKDFEDAVNDDDRIQDVDFFIYYGGSHIAIHEVLPNGENSERLLLITI